MTIEEICLSEENIDEIIIEAVNKAEPIREFVINFGEKEVID